MMHAGIWLLYMGVGAFAGLFAGLLGIGGGLLVVPCLMILFARQGFPSESIMHFAVGTSLLTMVVTAGSSMISHRRQGMIAWDLYRRVAWGIIPGVSLGIIVGHHFHSIWLQWLFGSFAMVLAIQMIRDLRNPDRHEGREPLRTPMWCPALGVGTLSGLLGTGSGIFAPILLGYRLDAHRVVALCAACSFTVALVGSLLAILLGSGQHYQPAYSYGYVYAPAVLGMASLSPLSAWVGARISSRLPTRVLRLMLLMILLSIVLHCFAPLLQGVLG